MVISETVSLWFGGVGMLVGLVSTGIVIYQWAVINEGKKRKNEFQYILVGINAAANQKQRAWQNQISLPTKPATPEEWNITRILVRARDDIMELANLTSALEGTIDTENSAIVAMMDKYKTIVTKNSEINKSVATPVKQENNGA